MLDSFIGTWAQESHLSAEILESLRDLNHRFLDLAAARTDWPGHRVAALSAAQRAAAAGCPYALFDLRFQDDGHWRLRLQNSGSPNIADECPVDDETASFVRLALFYAWHIASGPGLKAQLQLGMNDGTAAAFSRITVNQLPVLVATEAVHLSPRWSGNTAYWSALTAAASRTDSRVLNRVQLYGLQLTAAARLKSPRCLSA
jgi:hypothetical protein